MKKKKYSLMFFVWLSLIVLAPINVEGLTKEQYNGRNICGEGKYELAGAHTDHQAAHVACYNNFYDAHNAMVANGADDLIIFERKNGNTTLVDAQYALMDLTVNPAAVTYYFPDEKDETRENNYMDNGSLYGGVDGAYLSVNIQNKVAHLKTAGYDGWINPGDYEIVPINWVRSSTSYTITNDTIRHNYAAKIQNTYSGNSGRIIGPKPTGINTGTYYSYDGKYFYKTRLDMLKDYKKNTHERAVNSNNPYYNYYLYLPNHSKTVYSSLNIDTYIRDVLGYTKDVYGDKATSKTSRLYGKGTFFYYAQQKYGVNAILALSLSRNETANGTSNLSINKNNGFGLNAVDSNPTEAATWYPSFADSILGYASKWITYGYANPFDFRYRSSVFGNKGIGMNIKYASDPYWSEKMASNYYAFDSYYGFQDYNYYQLGVNNATGIPLRISPNNNGKVVYNMNYLDTSFIITEEVVGDYVNGNNKWYKIVSDLNIDSNGNQLYAYSNYNWNSAYVYIPACFVTKINQGKNGLISPTQTTSFKDSNYTYDLYINKTEESGPQLNPKVAKITKDSNYYYDASLTEPTGKKVLQDKYVMVYTAAYNNQGKAVAYLITSDYKWDQKEWVKADCIKLINSNYGKETITLSGQYAWVNYNTVDSSNTVISGQYTNSYFPILDTINENGKIWYKIPVNLEGNNNSYGYILAKDTHASVTVYNSNNNTNDEVASDNEPPVILANNKEILAFTSFDALKDVTANDKEDGNITNKITILSNNVDTTKSGTYVVVYQVIDSAGLVAEKKITVTVKENKDPVFEIEDQEITVGDTFDPLENIKVIDEEDGDLTQTVEVIKNTVNTKEIGIYQVIYQVTTKQNIRFTKTIEVRVIEDERPIIEAQNKIITLNTNFDPLKDVIAFDKEDGNLTDKIKVIKNTTDTKKLGTYFVIYQVQDSKNHITTLEISVTVTEKVLTEKEGEFYLESLKWNEKEKKYSITGYLKIIGINNTKEEEIQYEFILASKSDNKKSYAIPVRRMLKDLPFDLEEENGKTYTYSWFQGNLDFKDIPQDDYSLYMKAYTKDYYTYQAVNNILNNKIDKRQEDDIKGYNFKVNLNLKAKTVDLSIRDGKLIASSSLNDYRNMINNYDTINFDEEKLHLMGTSYNYGISYENEKEIKRILYLENVKTFKRYSYELGSTKKGSYEVSSTDHKSKDYVWYDKKIDLTILEKGTYSLQVYTKVGNYEDYGEIVDIFGSIEEAKATINGKKYEVSLNKNRGNRIELVVS